MASKNKVVKHLKGDIKMFKKEAQEDKELLRSMKKKKAGKKLKKGKKESKIEKVMHEFKEGELHSGSKKGPKVRGKKQAIAIGLSESRKAGEKVAPLKKKKKK